MSAGRLIAKAMGRLRTKPCAARPVRGPRSRKMFQHSVSKSVPSQRAEPPPVSIIFLRPGEKCGLDMQVIVSSGGPWATTLTCPPLRRKRHARTMWGCGEPAYNAGACRPGSLISCQAIATTSTAYTSLGTQLATCSSKLSMALASMAAWWNSSLGKVPLASPVCT